MRTELTNSPTTGVTGQTLAEEWNGSPWSTMTTGNLADSEFGAPNSGGVVGLLGARAAHRDSAYPLQLGVAELWDDSSWSAMTTPDGDTVDLLGSGSIASRQNGAVRLEPDACVGRHIGPGFVGR